MGSDRAERIEELAGHLGRLAEALGDLAMDALREGLEEGSDTAAEAAVQRERLVNRARTSVLKAVSLLEQAAEPTGDRPGDD